MAHAECPRCVAEHRARRLNKFSIVSLAIAPVSALAAAHRSVHGEPGSLPLCGQLLLLSGGLMFDAAVLWALASWGIAAPTAG